MLSRRLNVKQIKWKWHP